MIKCLHGFRIFITTSAHTLDILIFTRALSPDIRHVLQLAWALYANALGVFILDNLAKLLDEHNKFRFTT